MSPLIWLAKCWKFRNFHKANWHWLKGVWGGVVVGCGDQWNLWSRNRIKAYFLKKDTVTSIFSDAQLCNWIVVPDSLTHKRLAFSTIYPLFVDRFCYLEFDKEAIFDGCRSGNFHNGGGSRILRNFKELSC